MNKLKDVICANKLVVFVGGAIGVSSLLVAASMWVYYQSDAYRLDLSRPEYKSRRAEISKDTKEESHNFSAQGPVNEKTIDEFLRAYTKESKDVLELEAFSNDVLSDKNLGINDIAGVAQ